MVQAVRSRIEETNTQFTSAAARGDTSTMASLYTEDATVLPPNMTGARGRAEIKRLFDNMFQQMGTPALQLSRPALIRFANFVLWGVVLGWVGFMGLPSLFHARLSPDPSVFGPAVFVFIFVMWINIHHYFIDNVIWRRDNEDVRKYLFAPR